MIVDLSERPAAAPPVSPRGDRPGRYLAVESGDEPAVIALERPVTRIGRGLTADVRLEDPAVSRRQALVMAHADRTVLLDDRSRNGTWCNGQRVAEIELHDGDVIAVGGVRLRFRDVPA